MARMRSEALPDALVPALRNQVRIELAEGGREAVWVAERETRSAPVLHADEVTEHVFAPIQSRLEDASGARARGNLAAEVGYHRDALRVGPVHANDHAGAIRMDSEHGIDRKR